MEAVLVSFVSGWPGMIGMTAQLPVVEAGNPEKDPCAVMPATPLISVLFHAE